jgi:hypothetical protein
MVHPGTQTNEEHSFQSQLSEFLHWTLLCWMSSRTSGFWPASGGRQIFTRWALLKLGGCEFSFTWLSPQLDVQMLGCHIQLRMQFKSRDGDWDRLVSWDKAKMFSCSLMSQYTTAQVQAQLWTCVFLAMNSKMCRWWCWGSSKESPSRRGDWKAIWILCLIG